MFSSLFFFFHDNMSAIFSIWKTEKEIPNPEYPLLTSWLQKRKAEREDRTREKKNEREKQVNSAQESRINASFQLPIASVTHAWSLGVLYDLLLPEAKPLPLHSWIISLPPRDNPRCILTLRNPSYGPHQTNFNNYFRSITSAKSPGSVMYLGMWDDLSIYN